MSPVASFFVSFILTAILVRCNMALVDGLGYKGLAALVLVTAFSWVQLGIVIIAAHPGPAQ